MEQLMGKVFQNSRFISVLLKMDSLIFKGIQRDCQAVRKTKISRYEGDLAP